MSPESEKFFASLLARLPEAERVPGMAFVRRTPNGGAGDVVAGFLSISLAGGLSFAESAARIEVARVAVEKAALAADPLRQIPGDLAKQIVGQIDTPGIAKEIGDIVSKTAGAQAVAETKKAAIGAVADIAKLAKEIGELVPIIQGHTLSLSEAGKSVVETGKVVEAQAGRILEIARGFGDIIDYAITENRRLQWGVVACLTALILVPLTWTIRGCFVRPPPAPVLSSLIEARGGELQFSDRGRGGSFIVAIHGGTVTTPEQNWTVVTFPAPAQTTTGK
jgi:hypothetical protein